MQDYKDVTYAKKIWKEVGVPKTLLDNPRCTATLEMLNAEVKKLDNYETVIYPKLIEKYPNEADVAKEAPATNHNEQFTAAPLGTSSAAQGIVSLTLIRTLSVIYTCFFSDI